MTRCGTNDRSVHFGQLKESLGVSSLDIYMTTNYRAHGTSIPLPLSCAEEYYSLHRQFGLLASALSDFASLQHTGIITLIHGKLWQTQIRHMMRAICGGRANLVTHLFQLLKL